MKEYIVSIAIFDFDGTLFDDRHRLHLLEGEHKDYKKYNSLLINDPAFPDVVDAVISHWLHKDRIFFLTGRTEDCGADTLNWLHKYLPQELVDNVTIYMRGTGDHRSTVDMKRATINMLSEKYRILAFYDNDDDNLAMAAEFHIDTIYRCENGEIAIYKERDNG